MLYPTSVLKGNGAKSEIYRNNFCRKRSTPRYRSCSNTLCSKIISSTIMSKSISKNGGIAIYRGLVKAQGRYNSKSTITCESLMLDNISRSDTIPVIDIQNQKLTLVTKQNRKN